MKSIQIAVNDKIATRTNDVEYVCGNSDFVVDFTFDAEWNEFDTKTARFAYNGEHQDVVFKGTQCPVPVISGARYIKVGVYAGDIHTTTPAYVSARKSILCDGGLPADPAPDVYAQIMELIQGLGEPDPEDIANAVADYISKNPITVEETDPTVHDWAKAETKPTYTADEVGAIAETELQSAIDTALAQAKASGEFDGPAGADGIGIQSVEQTTTSAEDGGTNVVTVTKTDGTTSTFSIKNGSKGSAGPAGADGAAGPAGSDGVDGKTAYQYAVEAGYTGTEAAFAERMAAEIPSVDSTLTKAGQAADAKAAGDRLAALSEAIGDLSGLNTVDKSSLVAAINEVLASGGGESGGEEPTSYTVKNQMTNASTNNTIPRVSAGASYTSKLTAADGYVISAVTVTMGGTDITATAWDADTSTISIPSVTGDVIITCIATEQSGGEVLDTSPVIAVENAQTNRGEGTTTNAYTCVTQPYKVKEVSEQVTLVYCTPWDRWYSGLNDPAIQLYLGDTYVTYWTQFVGKDAADALVEHTQAINNNYGNCDSVRLTLWQNHIDNSYAYVKETGEILFAGANTQYYGMTNINGNTGGESAVSVAAEVDNQVAMLSLSTGETADTSAYSGLSSDYVAMVQANYDAMMAECLGDYNKIPLIVHTDQHGRIGASNQVMKLIGDMVNWYEVSKCINLGDTVTDRFGTTELENYLSATKDSIPLSKRLDVYGNHDIWDADDDQKYTVSQKRLSPYFKNIYARRHGNNGYFTVVDDYYNVKYLVINNMEYPDTNYSKRRITTAQAKFIVSELSEDDGRDIVIVSHVPFDSDEVTSRDDTYAAYSEKFLSDTTAHNSFMAMLSARKSKTSGSFTDSEGVAHAYDFSGVSGDLLMSLHGHAHFEAYRTFDNSVTEFIFDWFDGNTFYFAYIDRQNKKFKAWKNETDVEALEISIA